MTKINVERMVSEFTKLISIDSPSYKEREMADYLKQRLEGLGFSVEEDDWGSRFGGNAGNIYASLSGNRDLPPVLFSCHMDTVEPALGKRAVVGDDGVIRSAGDTILGADDMAGVVAILEAVSRIQESGISHRPIEILFTVAEEVYCKGAGVFDYSKIKSKEAYVLDLTGVVGTAANKAPSIITFKAAVRGKAAHAGFAPEQGVHAIAVCAEAISKLKQGRLDDETTFNIGLIRGGKANNIIPDLCEVDGEIRSYDHAKAVDAVEAIRLQFAQTAERYGAQLDFAADTHFEAYETPADHAVVRRFQEICVQKQLPYKLVATFGGSDNHHLASHGIAGIVLANAMNACHSNAEYTTIDELTAIAEVTLELMR